MDPEATIKLVHAALGDGEYEDALDHVNNLLEWTMKGGFLPRGTTHKDLQRLRTQAFDGLLRQQREGDA